MRIVFMGSPDFAVPTLDALVAAGHEVAAVYAQPPRPAGRGKSDRKTAVQTRAEQLGIEVRTPRTLRNAEEQQAFIGLGCDFAVVAAYGLILPLPILEAPRFACINVHASLLPRWRGAAPIQRAILAGDEETGITLMEMEEGLDTGPMLMSSAVPIDSKTSGELTRELALVGGELVRQYLELPNAFPARPQPLEGITYAKKIEKQEARLDFDLEATVLERQVRAFNPLPGAWFAFQGERIKVLKAEVVDVEGLPGITVDDHLTISCGRQALRPLIVQRAGKSPTQTADFLRGFHIPRSADLNSQGTAEQ